MNPLKQLKKRLHAEPAGPHAAILRHLVQSLYLGEPLDLPALYELDHEDFKLALSILGSWRLDRFTDQKERLWELAGPVAKNPPARIGLTGAGTNPPPHQETYC
ncbi:MAG: hypothetical protein AB7U30_08300 [Sulfuricellaceae bacterium]|jgi:hypothetical protein